MCTKINLGTKALSFVERHLIQCFYLRMFSVGGLNCIVICIPSNLHNSFMRVMLYCIQQLVYEIFCTSVCMQNFQQHGKLPRLEKEKL